VDSAEAIGLSLGISPFIIGVTIIAFGTSLPELATSIASVYSGTSEIVIGNVVGSNITNILLVLGFTAFLGKGIKLEFDVMDIDMPLLLGSAFLMFLCLMDGQFGLFDLLLFLVGLLIFLLNSFKGEKTEKASRPKVLPRDYVILIISAVFVYFSANYCIDAIENLAMAASIDPHIIALTVVALGTSLPELIVSIAAARKGKHAMAVGNVLGSNIFNTYAVMGISAFFGTLEIPASIISFDLIIMVVASILFAIVCIGGKISKWEGAMLLLFYAYFVGENVKAIF
jgi:cation:H+ antiporter